MPSTATPSRRRAATRSFMSATHASLLCISACLLMDVADAYDARPQHQALSKPASGWLPHSIIDGANSGPIKHSLSESDLFDYRGGEIVYGDGDDDYYPTAAAPASGADPPGDHYYDLENDNIPMAEDRETVQERVDQWRHQQRDQASATLNSARDEQGRMKLMTSVGKGSRALIFFVLMWRNVHLYEMADQTLKGATRLLFVTPLVVLFIGNMAGAVASITSPSQSGKKRLKAILNLDKLQELLLAIWYCLRLTILPNKYVPRETYISSILHSVFFIIQCQAFTKLSWDEAKAPSVASYAQHQYEERQAAADDTPMEDDSSAAWRDPSSAETTGSPYERYNY